MGSIIDGLKSSFSRGNINIKLIYINVAVFAVTAVIQLIPLLFNHTISLDWIGLPASVGGLLDCPWTIVTYMFMHKDPIHLLFNMVWLYWVGGLSLSVFSAKHLRGLYLLGGFSGGLLYVIAYNVFPYFNDRIYSDCLIGASASVLAIVAAVAYREPERQVQLFFWPIKLKIIAWGVIILDLLFMTSDNGGGHIAHVGGAAMGVLFSAGLNKGIDLTHWINAVIDGVVRLFSFSRKPRKPKMEVHYGKRQDDYDYNSAKKEKQERIDKILDKIKKTGYQNLSDEEKRELFNASNK